MDDMQTIVGRLADVGGKLVVTSLCEELIKAVKERDALLADLAETQRQLKMVAPIGKYNGRDIKGWAKHAGALEAAIRGWMHESRMQSFGDRERMRAEMASCLPLPTPLASPPYPWCRQPSVCRGTCPMDPSCGE